MIIVLLFLVLLFGAVVIIGPLVGVSFWPLVGYAWMAMVVTYVALVMVSEWHKKRRTDEEYKSLAEMELRAYEAWTRTCRCVDCGKAHEPQSGEWATETQCWPCFVAHGNPERRGLSSAGELYGQWHGRRR